MMSTGGVAEISTEQSVVPISAPDRRTFQESSFAQSFDQGIDAITKMMTKRPSTEGYLPKTEAVSAVNTKSMIANLSSPGSSQRPTYIAAAVANKEAELDGPPFAANAPAEVRGFAEQSLSQEAEERDLKLTRTSVNEIEVGPLDDTLALAAANITARPQAQVYDPSDGTLAKPNTAEINKQSISGANEIGKVQQNTAASRFARKITSATADTIIPNHNRVPTLAINSGSEWLMPSGDLSKIRSGELGETVCMKGDIPKAISTSSSNQTNSAQVYSTDSSQIQKADPVADGKSEQKATLTLEPNNVGIVTDGNSSLVPASTEVEKRAATFISHGGDMNKEVSAASINLFHVGAEALGVVSTPISASIPHVGVTSAALDKSLHSEEAMTHGAELQSRSDDLSSSGTLSNSINGLPQLLTSTPTTLEVGVMSDAHGWLKVRAELTESGAVNASVSTTSSASQAILHQELPGIAAYLQQEKVTVNTVAIHPPTIPGTEWQGSAVGTSIDHGNQKQQERGHEQYREQDFSKTNVEGITEASAFESGGSRDEQNSLPALGYSGGGSWLSIRA